MTFGTKNKTAGEREERRVVRELQRARLWSSKARSHVEQGKPLSPRAQVELEMALVDTSAECDVARVFLKKYKGAVASAGKTERMSKLSARVRKAEYGEEWS